MLKVLVGNKAIVQKDSESEFEVYDEETGDFCGYDSEYQTEEVDSPLDLDQKIDDDFSVWNAEFCKVALRRIGNVVKAEFYFTETTNGLMAMAELTIDKPSLTADDVKNIIDDVAGQFSDGWGEGFEQHPQVIDGEEYYFVAYNQKQLPEILDTVKVQQMGKREDKIKSEIIEYLECVCRYFVHPYLSDEAIDKCKNLIKLIEDNPHDRWTYVKTYDDTKNYPHKVTWYIFRNATLRGIENIIRRGRYIYLGNEYDAKIFNLFVGDMPINHVYKVG